MALIDLVIIILGILSAVAVRIATLQGIEGAMASTSQLVEMKAKIEGVENVSINIDGQTVLVNNAYITGH